MEIITAAKLSPDQKAQVLELHEECAREDGRFIPLLLACELNFDPRFPCFHLGYEGERLVGYLTAFIPSRQEAEVVALVSPGYRRRGWFTAMYRHLAKGLRKLGVPKVLFVVGAECLSGRALMAHYGARVDHRELRMLWDSSRGSVPLSPDLTAVLVTLEQKEACNILTDSIFAMGDEETDAFIRQAISEPDREAFMALRQGAPIGVYLFHRKGEEIFLYGVGIAPTEQGHGYGKQLMGLALNEVKKRADRVALDVDAENTAACALYKSCGFVTECRTDYYAYQVK